MPEFDMSSESLDNTFEPLTSSVDDCDVVRAPSDL